MGKLFNPLSKFVGKAAMDIPNAEPHGVGSAQLSDTKGPTFDVEFLTPQVLDGLEQAGYSQSDVNSFLTWMEGVHANAYRQGFSNEELMYRYFSALKPQVLQFGEDPLKSLGMAPRPDSAPSYNDALGDPTYSVAPKGGPNSS